MPTVLNSLGPIDWAKLVAALVLMLGPGIAILSATGQHRFYDKTQMVVAAFSLSVAAWAVALAWLQLVGVTVNGMTVTLGLVMAWCFAIYKLRSAITLKDLPGKILGDRLRIALWSVGLCTLLLSLWAIQGLAVGSGIDSYHHTLIAQMIVQQGRLPDNYEPYAPLVTFSYHFGFHGLVAALATMTGIGTVSLVPIIGQLLIAGAALSAAFMAEAFFQNRLVGLIAAVVVGLVSPVPAAFGNWARYPQLTGILLQMVLLATIYSWSRQRFAKTHALSVVVLAAGLVLVHYRVTLMTMVGAPIMAVLGTREWNCPLNKWRSWAEAIERILLAVVSALVLITPWLWHIINTRTVGYPMDFPGVSTDGSSFSDLSRLGPWVLDHPANGPLLSLCLVATLVAIWRRELRVVALFIWAIALLVLSAPGLLGPSMDTVTVAMSLFVQGSIAVAWIVFLLADQILRRAGRFAAVVGMAVAVLVGLGILKNSSAIDPANVFVRKDDLEAITWIRSNTPESALFMVNMFHFGFSDSLISGSDAGYWLPLLAGRRTVVLPMTYGIERSGTSDSFDTQKKLDGLNGRLESPTAIGALEQKRVTYVYIGSRGGPIDPAELIKSSAYQLAYRNGTVYVFRFVSSR